MFKAMDSLGSIFSSDNRVEKTVANYTNITRNIYKQMKGEGEIASTSWFSDVDRLLELLGKFKLKTKRCYLLPLYILAKELGDTELAERLYAIYIDWTDLSKDDSQGKSEEEEKNWITYDEIIKKRNELKKEIYKIIWFPNREQIRKLMQWLLLCFITMLPIARNENYSNLRIEQQSKATDPEQNYLVLQANQKKALLYNKYKTVKTLGVQTIELPTELVTAINKSLKILPRHYVFARDRENSLSTSDINILLRDLWKPKKVTFTLLRKIVITEFYKDQMGTQERREYDHKCFHSSESTDRYYIRK